MQPGLITFSILPRIVPPRQVKITQLHFAGKGSEKIKRSNSQTPTPFPQLASRPFTLNAGILLGTSDAQVADVVPLEMHNRIDLFSFSILLALFNAELSVKNFC
jgi:hypothetical protein